MHRFVWALITCCMQELTKFASAVYLDLLKLSAYVFNGYNSAYGISTEISYAGPYLKRNLSLRHVFFLKVLWLALKTMEIKVSTNRKMNKLFVFIMSPPFRVGRHIVFPRGSVCLSVCLSVRLSVCLSVTNRVRSITWKPLKLYSRNFIQISISMRWRAECKNGNSGFYIF